MASADDIRTTIANYIARFSAGDRDGWIALFADDATIEDPVGSEVKKGHQGLGEFWDFVHSLSPSIVLSAAGPACLAGPEAAFPITIVNDLGEMKMELDAIDVMTFSVDGRIASMRAFWDMADMRSVNT